MKQTFFTIFLASVILTGCVTTQETRTTTNVSSIKAAKDCDFPTAQGKEFVFRKQSPSLQKYGYQSWKRAPDISGNKLNYKNYVGRYGKVKTDTVSGKYKSKWFVALTDTCEAIYTSARARNGQKPIGDLEKFTGIYFTESIKKAKSLIGKDIWTKVPFGVKKARVLFTSDPNVSYPKGNIEKLRVINIDSTAYGHTFGAIPFYLVVKTESGKEGLIPYSSKHFYESNPINSSWKGTVVDLIKSQKIQRGMTSEQALLSWGKPQKNNKSVGSYGVHEQWVYGNGQYLYFENNVLASFQT